jgi:hypothetical protein
MSQGEHQPELPETIYERLRVIQEAMAVSLDIPGLALEEGRNSAFPAWVLNVAERLRRTNFRPLMELDPRGREVD